MSDLAYSCEYLNIEKTCNAFSDNPKAHVTRQLKCQNDEKNLCCYLCTFRNRCTISCRYLGGQTDAFLEQKTEPVPERPITADKTIDAGASKFENVPVSFCFSCNVETAWANTTLNVDRWRGPKTSLDDCKALPLAVYVCPKCGRIEFKADIPKREAKP